MDGLLEFLILLFMFAIATRMIFQVWKAFKQDEYKERRADMIGPIICSFLVMLGIGFAFDVFDYLPLSVPVISGIIITTLVVAQASYEAHNVVAWFENKIFYGLTTTQSNNLTTFDDLYDNVKTDYNFNKK